MRAFSSILAVAWAVTAAGTLRAEPPKPVVIDLWPGAAPGESATPTPPEKDMPLQKEARPVRRVANVSKPTLTVFAPPADKASGAAVVIAPGGGYNILAWDLEGEEVAAWLNTVGVTAFVLKYRVPRRAEDAKDAAPKVALIDAQRAVRLVRSRAKEFNVDAAKVGMLGFSAGGNLTALTCTNYDVPEYAAVDAADEVSSRPDFAVLVYPAYLVESKTGLLLPSVKVTAKTPPTFLAHAFDDPVTPVNSLQYALELKRFKVPCELHLYSAGGHGYGLRPAGPATTWPKRCEEWLAAMKLTKN